MKIKDWGIIGKAPMCIKDLDIYIEEINGIRSLIGNIRDNYLRRIMWKSEQGEKFTSNRIIIVPKSNWGFHTFNIYEIRIY